MMVSERSHHKDVKSKNIFEICLSTQKIWHFESSIFHHFVTKNSTKWWENAISFDWLGIFQKCFHF